MCNLREHVIVLVVGYHDEEILSILAEQGAFKLFPLKLIET